MIAIWHFSECTGKALVKVLSLTLLKGYTCSKEIKLDKFCKSDIIWYDSNWVSNTEADAIYNDLILQVIPNRCIINYFNLKHMVNII